MCKFYCDLQTSYAFYWSNLSEHGITAKLLLACKNKNPVLISFIYIKRLPNCVFFGELYLKTIMINEKSWMNVDK